MRNKPFTKAICFALALLIICSVGLYASAAAICTPKTMVATYDEDEGLLAIKGTYTGMLQSGRAYMLSLVDANGRMISTKNVLGSQIDKGNGVFEYSFELLASALTNNTMPMRITLSCTTANVIDPITAEVTEPFTLGDVNNDGSIDNLDATLILQYDAGLLSQSISAFAGDANGDGAVDNLDAVLILKYDAGLIDKI